MTSWASVVLTYTLHSFAIGAIAMPAGLLLRRSPGLRVLLWKAALVAPLITVGAVVARGESSTLGLTSAIGRLVPLVPARVDVDVRQIRGTPAQRIERVRHPVGDMIVGLCAAVSLFGVLRGVSYLVRRRRFRQNVVNGRAVAHAALDGLQAVETDEVAVPVALASGVIALPRRFMSEGTERSRTAILMHEVAHVKRRDPEWVDIARTVAALTPWQPLNRIVVDRLERDVELAADAFALKMGADAQGLLEGLMHFSAQVMSPSPSGAPLVRAESPLVHRAREVLDPSSRETARMSLIAVVGMFLFVASAMAASPSVVPGTAEQPGTGQPGSEVVEIEMMERQPSR